MNTQELSVNYTDIGDKLAVRDTILQIEQLMSNMDDAVYGNTDKAPLVHRFTDGIYVRQITIFKGTLATGRIHKHRHPSIILSGDISFVSDEEGVHRVKAPGVFISPAGIKRLVYAHETTIWITIHSNPDNIRDLKLLEKELVTDSYDDLPEDIGNII